MREKRFDFLFEVEYNKYCCESFWMAFTENSIYAEMVEWSIAAVLKTVEVRTSGGSNPSLRANEVPCGGTFFVGAERGIIEKGFGP